MSDFNQPNRPIDRSLFEMRYRGDGDEKKTPSTFDIHTRLLSHARAGPNPGAALMWETYADSV